MAHLVFRSNINVDDYVEATYYLKSATTLKDAAWDIAIGQSVGNPNIRNDWETDDLFLKHSCVVLDDENVLSQKSEGFVRIGFPVVNTDWSGDGITQLLVQLMGGQLDIDRILVCQLRSLNIPARVKACFLPPKFGIEGIRAFTGVGADKPLLGAIIKPKIGLNVTQLLEMVKCLVESGVNFIKEDEIMSNPSCCDLETRVPVISEYIKNKKVVYAFCINADGDEAVRRAKRIHELGGNAIHLNFWAGFGTYRAIRKLDLPLFVHFQKSGDKILTKKEHDFHIDWNVFCQLAVLCGVDFIHAGMWGGYSNDDEADLVQCMRTLHEGQVMPALSCGMHPGLVQAIKRRLGANFMANCGGAIHGHPGGTRAGASAMFQAINGNTSAPEYVVAIEKWGIRE